MEAGNFSDFETREWQEVKPLLQRALGELKKSQAAQEVFRRCTYKRELVINFNELENAAGNHAFDDYPECFGLTKPEGHKIRGHIQQYGSKLKEKVEALIVESAL